MARHPAVPVDLRGAATLAGLVRVGGAVGVPAPDDQAALVSASAVIVPALILPEVDYSFREERAAMRKLVAEILDPRTRYELELPTPADPARAIEIDARFAGLGLGLVDGTVAAVAKQRRVPRVLRIDRKHFAALRVEHRALELVP